MILSIPATGCCALPCPALHKAIEMGDHASIRRLLDKGANPDNYTCECGYPLTYAADECDRNALELLLDAGAKTDDKVAELALRKCVLYCDQGTVALLLARGVDPNADYYLGGTVLMEAVERGQLTIVNMLLESGADPNQVGRYEGWVQPVIGEGSALMLSAKAGRVDLVRVLLDHGANPTATDVYGYTALRVAEQYGQGEMLELIRASLADRYRPQ